MWLVLFTMFILKDLVKVLMVEWMGVMLPRAGVAADRIDEVCRTKASIHDPDAATAKPALEKKNWDGVVRFEDVSFRFPGADSDALEHISFTAKPGETTAIIGSTGCGAGTVIAPMSPHPLQAFLLRAPRHPPAGIAEACLLQSRHAVELAVGLHQRVQAGPAEGPLHQSAGCHEAALDLVPIDQQHGSSPGERGVVARGQAPGVRPVRSS
jgi:hypothetical protein